MSEAPCRLLCDAMLGKLARWLRAAGYEAAWLYGIDDEDLVRQARSEGRVLVTSDGGLLTHRLIRDGTVHAVFVPTGTDTLSQLRHVLRRLDLPLAEPRCMACGGVLEGVEKATVVGEVPARAYARYDDYRRCRGCGKVYWPGTHWERIRATLDRALGDAAAP